MENATRALTIAGGVLIAIMVIGALLFMFQSSQSFLSQDEELKKIQQITKFNREYESYEKKLLRGTEVISVINKAIANNQKYEKDDEIYDIDVQFELLTAINKTTVKFVNGEKKVTKETQEFGAAKVYRIKDNKSSDRVNEEIKEFIRIGSEQGKEGYTTIEYKDERNYTIEYNGFTDFKRKIFKCTEIGYNSITGRVNLIKFEEIKMNEDLNSY